MSHNRLAKEKSPYLLQHKDNPVHWYAWGDEAFKAAKEQDKPIFLSIGYSTCHWCHVMEKDSFEKNEVADVMNKHFVCIKVDREERPDVDQIYMDAVMGMTGGGGWPMSVFLTHDLKPFYGGTFFWKDQFIQLLNGLANAWQTQREKIIDSGKQVTDFLKQKGKGEGAGELDHQVFKSAFSLFHSSFDAEFGGFGRAPKFPRSADLSLLFRIYRRTGNKDALRMATTTLDHMARGGMYDHLGGGFARYSTDAQWLTPHFEKMLYDNALLAWTYLEGYQVTGKEMYASVAREILDYVLRDMTHPEGGFYSAEDADSEGVEGKFYVWTQDELEKLLTEEEFKLFEKVYGITPHGNFENSNNILHLQPAYDWDIKKDPLIQSAHEKLFKVREKRVHPYKDDKVLTDWNGLMIAGMAKGYQVLGDERYLKAAQKATKFIKNNLYHVGAFNKTPLQRRYRVGESGIEAMLSDYAFLIHGLINLYESDFNPEWIQWAGELQKTQDELFWDKEQGGYFYSKKGAADLFMRKKESYDGATPSGNSVSVLNLLRLHDLTLEPDYLKRSQKILSVFAEDIQSYAAGYSMMLIGLDYLLDRSKEVAVVGRADDPNSKEILQFLHQKFLPNVVYAVGRGVKFNAPTILQNRKIIDGKTTIYVCENTICKLPTSDLKKAEELVSDFEKYEL